MLDREPDFINDIGVKWWRLDQYESELHKINGMNQCVLFLTEHPDGVLSYVIMDMVTNSIRNVRENVKLGFESVESFIAYAAVCKMAGSEVEDVELPFAVVPRDTLTNLLQYHGIANSQTSSFALSRAITAASEIIARSMASSMELLRDRMPLNRLHGTFVANHVESLTAETCMLQDSNMRYRRVVEEIAALVLPPGTYENIRNEPEKIVHAVREIREEWFKTLNTIEPQCIEHEPEG